MRTFPSKGDIIVCEEGWCLPYENHIIFVSPIGDSEVINKHPTDFSINIPEIDGHRVEGYALVRSDILCSHYTVFSAAIRAIRRRVNGRKGTLRDLGLEFLRCLVGTRQIRVAREKTAPVKGVPSVVVIILQPTGKGGSVEGGENLGAIDILNLGGDKMVMDCPYQGASPHKGWHPCLECRRNPAGSWGLKGVMDDLPRHRCIENYIMELGAMIELQA